MMKKTNFGPLLLLLLLAVTSRNSSANVIASPDGVMGGAPPSCSGSTVNGTTEGSHAIMSIAEDMKKGADILTAAMTWLQNNMLSSQFDESILDLENKILQLPSHLAENRAEILYGLYTSQDRFNLLRSRLELAATILKKDCENLIRMYNNNDSTLEIIIFGATKFESFAKSVNTILQKALDSTVEIYYELSASNAFLIDFNAKQDDEKKEIEAKQEAEGNIQVLKTKLYNQKQGFEIMINEDEQYTNKVPTSVNTILQKALDSTVEINDELSASNAFLIDFNAKQDDEKKEIEAKQEAEGNIQVLKTKLYNQKQGFEIMINEDEQYTDKVPKCMIIFCIFTLGVDCSSIKFTITDLNMQAATYEAVADRMELESEIDIQEKRQINIDKQSELLTNIKPVHKSATTLFSHVEDVKVYLETEITLITEWHQSLEASYYITIRQLNYDDITPEDIKCNIKGIKERLNVLKKACEEYLAHELPDILKMRES